MKIISLFIFLPTTDILKKKTNDFFYKEIIEIINDKNINLIDLKKRTFYNLEKYKKILSVLENKVIFPNMDILKFQNL